MGLPKVLQYNSQKNVEEPIETSKNLYLPNIEQKENIINVDSFMKDFNIYINGGKKCEFCGSVIKSWPTIEKQEYNNLIQVCYIFIKNYI